MEHAWEYSTTRITQRESCVDRELAVSIIIFVSKSTFIILRSVYIYIILFVRMCKRYWISLTLSIKYNSVNYSPTNMSLTEFSRTVWLQSCCTGRRCELSSDKERLSVTQRKMEGTLLWRAGKWTWINTIKHIYNKNGPPGNPRVPMLAGPNESYWRILVESD